MLTLFDIRQSETRILQDQLNLTAIEPMDLTLASINSELTAPGRLIAQATPSLVVTVGAGAIVNPNTGKNRSLAPLNGSVVAFPGGTITFPSTSGTVTVSPGTNKSITIGASQFVAVLVEVTDAGVISITVGTAAGTLAGAVVPAVNNHNLTLGYIVVQSNASSVIQNVTDSMLYQFTSVLSTAGSITGLQDNDSVSFNHSTNTLSFNYNGGTNNMGLAAGELSLGSDPAVSGTINLSNSQAISWRANPDTGPDVSLLVNSSNFLVSTATTFITPQVTTSNIFNSGNDTLAITSDVGSSSDIEFRSFDSFTFFNQNASLNAQLVLSTASSFGFETALSQFEIVIDDTDGIVNLIASGSTTSFAINGGPIFSKTSASAGPPPIVAGNLLINTDILYLANYSGADLFSINLGADGPTLISNTQKIYIGDTTIGDQYPILTSPDPGGANAMMYVAGSISFDTDVAGNITGSVSSSGPGFTVASASGNTIVITLNTIFNSEIYNAMLTCNTNFLDSYIAFVGLGNQISITYDGESTLSHSLTPLQFSFSAYGIRLN